MDPFDSDKKDLSSVLELVNTCRLCANQNERLIGIYSEEGISNDLAKKMNLYLPIKVSEHDTLPLQCCWSCASTILAWHDLVMASVEADRRFRAAHIEVDKPLEGIDDYTVVEVHEDIINRVQEDKQSTASLTAFVQTDESKKVVKKKKPKRENASESADDEKDNLSLPDLDDDSLGDDEVLSQWLQKTEKVELFSFCCQYCTFASECEDGIVRHMKGHHPECTDTLSYEDKKEKRKNTRIDQEAVNAAKVIVDGRVYYNCKICGKSLHSPYTYIWHMRIHTGERPYVCDLCGKQFRVSQGLVRHLRETHEGIKNFPCDICGRMFATRRNVVEHRRIHTNERPYICDLCGKTFKQKASLFVHNRSHTDSFPFRCTYCNQGFRTKPPLMIHITRHTGEKPYPCDVCGRCFRIKYELKRHRLIHSDEKPFSCSDCGLSFRQKRYLRNHNKVNHNRATP